MPPERARPFHHGPDGRYRVNGRPSLRCHRGRSRRIVAIDVEDLATLGAVHVKRKAPGPFAHPRHRHATEQVTVSACSSADRGVSLVEALFASDRIGQCLAVQASTMIQLSRSVVPVRPSAELADDFHHQLGGLRGILRDGDTGFSERLHLGLCGALRAEMIAPA